MSENIRVHKFVEAFMYSRIIFQYSEHPDIRELVKKHNGLDPLVVLMKNRENWEHKDLLSAVTGAQWKCAKLIDNIYHLEQLDVIPTYIQLLDNEDETVSIGYMKTKYSLYFKYSFMHFIING